MLFSGSLAGGSDDGLNCAVMLEVLEILSRSKTPLKHNVIFLFNGAEESMLQVRYCVQEISFFTTALV
jgi:acetylornithine deacetylase/succinyl-diaminopimelate desuccinylase-like protein